MKTMVLALFLLSAPIFAATPPVEDSTPPVEDSTWSTEQKADESSDDWGDDDWSDETSSPWQFSGFSEAAFGQFLQQNIVHSKQALNELRTRVELNYQHDLFTITAKGDLLYDGVLSGLSWQTRELNIAGSILPNLDVKIGRQVLTWGTGDYLFLNDLFAKDWQSFFSGRDDEYLKAPSTSARFSWYVNNFIFDFAWTPEFTPDNYLNGERFSFYSPQAGSLVAPAQYFKVNQTKNDQFSARIATTQNDVEYALYGYKGYWTTPVGVNAAGIAYFPKLTVWGASARLPVATGFLSGIANAEFSFYQSNEDRDGSNPNIANDQFKLLIGYEQEIAKSLTLGLQYYLEKTLNYQAYLDNSNQAKNTLVAKNNNLFTVRLRYSTLQDKLIWSLFSFYSPTNNDAYIKPSITYRANDSWSYSLGANIFQGKNNSTFFGQLEKNSNAWFRARYQF